MFGESGFGASGLFATQPAFAWAAVVLALVATAVLVWYLVRKPILDPTVKGLLLFGYGVLPIAIALIANLVTFEHMKGREFCGSCHVMEPYTGDAAAFDSLTLASRHSRNDAFGDESCYTCHQDYGMYGTILTKWGGLQHVYHYYLHYQDLSIDSALERIEIYIPYPSSNCIECHSTEVPIWNAVDEHRGVRDSVRSGELSCASASCHGPAHPAEVMNPQAFRPGGAEAGDESGDDLHGDSSDDEERP
jgi:cytochrome c-type protein NapC